MLEPGLDRYTPVGEGMPHRRAEVQSSPSHVTTLPGEARRQLAGEGLDGFAHRLELISRGVHELDVLRQRLAHAARERLGPSGSDQSAVRSCTWRICVAGTIRRRM